MPTTISLQHITKVFSGEEPPTEGGLLQVVGKAVGLSQGSSPPSASRLPEDPSRVRALDDITLTVRPGEILGVLGPSGCGKTTLLRIAAGLLEPTSGEVRYDGVLLSEIPPAERGIGMVFQNYALYPHLPGEENIGFFLRLRKREHEIPQRIRDISRMMNIDLDPLLARKPPTLSGGEQQRLAIARCLARDPRVFFFDEPFSNLDAKLRTSARAELKRLLQRFRVTSIYVTHDQTEAIALSDRIAILHEGRLVQVGTYDQLYNMPVNTFVAGFFGSPPMNLFSGHAEGSKWVSAWFEWAPIRPDLEEDTPIVLGIRPEHFVLDEKGPIEVVAELVEPIFGERVQLIYARIGPSTRVTLRLPLDTAIRRGDRLRLSIIAEQVHLFDQETGTRIG